MKSPCLRGAAWRKMRKAKRDVDKNRVVSGFYYLTFTILSKAQDAVSYLIFFRGIVIKWDYGDVRVVLKPTLQILIYLSKLFVWSSHIVLDIEVEVPGI
jgi:hypothetical protein